MNRPINPTRPLQGRYELKFPVGLGDATGLLESCKGSLVPDPHAEAGGYRVSSLYFDSPALRAYWEKLDGEARRRKFRLRFYSPVETDAPELGAAKMEIKYRLNNRVFKERVSLTPDGAEALLSGDRRLSELEECVRESGPEVATTVEAIVRADRAQALEPVNIITYVREAWVGREDPRLRVTVDHRLRAYRPGEHRWVASESGALLVPEAASVLEVKFDHAIPREIRDHLQRSGIRLRRFSKYAAGLETPEFTRLAPGLVALSASARAQRAVFDQIESSAPVAEPEKLPVLQSARRVERTPN